MILDGQGDLTEKVTFLQRTEGSMGPAMSISGRRVLQIEKRANAEALRCI